MFDKLKDAVVSTVNRAAYGAPPEGGPSALANIALRRLDGSALPSAELEGKVVLFVNVASRCGLTPQYAELEKLATSYKERGFLVVGAPCNQFLGQEPGTPEEIATFCKATYGVDFPILEKQDVNGAERSPLYQWRSVAAVTSAGTSRNSSLDETAPCERASLRGWCPARPKCSPQSKPRSESRADTLGGQPPRQAVRAMRRAEPNGTE